MASTLPPDEFKYQQEHINDDRSPGLIAFLVIAFVLSSIFVFLRFTSRRLARAPLRADDWTILAALFTILAQFICTFLQITHGGFGRHALANGPDSVFYTLRVFYAWGIFYDINVNLIKISILLLYMRIFVVRWFRTCCWIFLAFLTAFCATLILVDLFGCTPVQKQWDFRIEGHCVNFLDTYYFASAIFILTDLLLLVMPLPLVWALQITRAQKIGVSLLFGLGIIVTIATIFRLVSLIRQDAYDSTWSFVVVIYWMGAEICLGVICACAATLPPLFNRKRYATFKGYTNSTSAREGVSGSSGKQDSIPSLKESTAALGNKSAWTSRLVSYAEAEKPNQANEEAPQGINVTKDVAMKESA